MTRGAAGHGGEERAGEVDGEHIAPLVQAELEEGGARARPGVVDEHVEPAERVRQLGDRGLDVLRPREVEASEKYAKVTSPVSAMPAERTRAPRP